MPPEHSRVGVLDQPGVGTFRHAQSQTAERSPLLVPPYQSSELRKKLETGKGHVTEQDILKFLYESQGRTAHPVATDSFLGKSKSEYNAAWLSREIVQNFVDHNVAHKGTLDGVRIQKQTLPDGFVRFTIEGDWPYTDSTGILSPHSEKPVGKSAGGMGIGLKQAAIRLMRDFSVRNFTITGEQWTAQYQLARASMINAALQKMVPGTPREVRHDWLMAITDDAENQGKNSYQIETSDPEMIACLSRLGELGVSKENPFLRDLDYASDKGAIKWLSPEQAKSGEASRLFINGQVMNYKEKGKNSEEYWRGPEGVTIQLNNIDYNMSVDRPPVSSYDLARYVGELVRSMSLDQVLDQLKRSEKLWGGRRETGSGLDRSGYAVLLGKLTEQLSTQGFDPAQYEAIFPDRKYLCWDRGISENQVQELESQGYQICANYFEALGMPKASSKLDTLEVASNVVPTVSRTDREKFAQDHGLSVGYEELEVSDTSSAGLATILKDKLLPYVAHLDVSDTQHRLSFTLKAPIPRDLLFRSVKKPKTDEQQALVLLRGIAAHALKYNLAEKLYLATSGTMCTFAIERDLKYDEDELLQRNSQVSGDRNVFVLDIPEGSYASVKSLLGLGGDKGDSLALAKPAAPAVVRIPVQRPEASTAITRPDGDDASDATEGVIERAWSAENPAWTQAEEDMFKLATTKKAKEMTSAERAVVMKKMNLAREFNTVPVNFVPPQRELREPSVVRKTVELPEATKKRLAELGEKMPGIVSAVQQLEDLVPRKSVLEENDPNRSAAGKYMEWRKSDEFYGQLAQGARYMTGENLIDILGEANQADIAVVEAVRAEGMSPTEFIMKVIEQRVKAVAENLKMPEHDINDFEIILNPTEDQMAQLALLRFYAQLATGADIPNDVFIYKGTGSKGVNIGQRAIGLHESLLGVSFSEARSTFVHEIAHNHPEAADHSVLFQNIMQALFTKIIDRATEVTKKVLNGQKLEEEEWVIVDVERAWDRLRNGRQ